MSREGREGSEVRGDRLSRTFTFFAGFARQFANVRSISCGTLNFQPSTPLWQRSAVRLRLDQMLVERGLCESREKAKRAIMAGTVRVNGQVAAKPSDSVREVDCLELTAGEKFVSRGGHKLEHALEHFQIDVRGLTVVDLGASTGGFTDCLLQRGAAKVFAVDVGQGQLAWKLRNDPRVIVMEKTNARTLAATQFPQPFLPASR